MRFVAIIEKAVANYSAKCAGTFRAALPRGRREETEEESRAAVRFHLKGLKEDGLAAPEPQTTLAYVVA